MRLFCGIMIALSLGLYVAYEQYVSGASAAVSEEEQATKLKALKARFDEEVEELDKRFQKAATEAEGKGIQTEFRELATLTAEKARKIVEENPKSQAAFDTIMFTMGHLAKIGAKGPDIAKQLEIAGENHLNNPKLKDLVMVAGRGGAAGEKFLQTVADKGPDKEIKAIALLILGNSYGEQSDDAPSEKAAQELVAKAVDYLSRAAKESPDTKLGREKIGAIAADLIKNIKLLAVGSPIPDLQGTELRDSKKQKLSDYKGNVVLVDVWATWCGPCRAMIPHEREMMKRLSNKPFKLISVSVDKEKSALTKFLDKEPMPWIHWWDGVESPLMETLKVKGFPTLYLIDAKGIIRKKMYGYQDPEVLDKAVDELVKEASKKG